MVVKHSLFFLQMYIVYESFFVYYMSTNYRHIGLAMKSMTKLRKCYRFIACLTNFYKWMPADEK